jgi:hypothetical protein
MRLVNFVSSDRSLSFDRECERVPERKEYVKFQGILYRVKAVMFIMQDGDTNVVGSLLGKSLPAVKDFYRVEMEEVEP